MMSLKCFRYTRVLREVCLITASDGLLMDENLVTHHLGPSQKWAMQQDAVANGCMHAARGPKDQRERASSESAACAPQSTAGVPSCQKSDGRS